MSKSRRSGRGSVYLGLAGGLFLASGGLLGGYFVMSRGDQVQQVAAAELADGPAKVDRKALDAVVRAADDFIGKDATVHYGEEQVKVPWTELGVGIDEAAAAAMAARAGGGDAMSADNIRKSGGLPISFDRDAALEKLLELKQRYDRSPLNARLDLEARKVHQHQDGFVVDAYASLGSIEAAARAGSHDIELRGMPLPAEITVKELGVEDISHVLGSFTTKFAVNDKARNYNLKLAASKLNGFVMKPGVEFSFNDVVGDRTEKEGYKIAGVITAGEMVDGLAGGTCQISSTLHGAAFFAGIGITRSIPHSRPSTYVEMGLDATVVYPHVDLKLVNNYDFPVVIHYKVARGESVVEILGPKRPYDKIEFERVIEDRLDFTTVTREDATMPVGSMSIDQNGFYGYKLKRFRKYYKNGKLVKTDKWDLQYRPVTEYARIGINLDPNLAPPKAPDKTAKALKVPKNDRFVMAQ